MQLGMIGLGRMGSNMVRRLMRAGHECVCYDRSPDAVKAVAAGRRIKRRQETGASLIFCVLCGLCGSP